MAGAGAAAAPGADGGAAPAADSIDRLAAGIVDILTLKGSSGGNIGSGSLHGAANAKSLAMEVKSLRFTENRSSADCLRIALPLLLAAIPRPAPFAAPAFLAGVKATLTAWKPFLDAFVGGHGACAYECLCVRTLAR
jgi:hypothetical protein